MRKYLKQACVWGLALAMVLPGPAELFAQAQTTKPKTKTVNYDNEDLNHRRRLNDDKLPVLLGRPAEGKTSEKFIEDPAQPAIYTLRTDYKAEKGEKYSVNYQPYVASVGAAATEDEQNKVNKKIDLPNMAGYEKPAGEESFINSYDAIKGAAEFGHQTGDKENGLKFLALREYKYKAIQNNIKVKHVFQDMEDFNKFTNKDGTITKNDGTVIDKDGTETKYDLKDPAQKEQYLAFARDHENIRILSGNTGSTLEVQALQENERPGFEPQVEKLKTQVPEDTSEFKIEYRYNRAAYNVVFDTKDGTPLPTRTYYYDQEIPKIDENSIPTKIGSEFLGWMPSHDLEGADGTKYKKGDIIKDASGNAIVDLGNTFYKKDGSGNLQMQNGDPVKGTNENEIKLKMPALKLGDGKSIPREKLTFTAVWKDKEKADYATQFWVEKADHPDNASLLNKYDYMGTRVHQSAKTGSTPNLDTEPVDGLKFPDLDQARLNKIWKGDKFNRGHDLYLNKFFVYNEKLTDEQNKDPNKPTVTKAVSATGKTVYNIYYDRQVYDLYFTKSNAQPEKNTIYPEIWGYDPAKGESVMLGGPGKPYHYKARFNEMMYKWPNDAKQTKGFTPGYQSFGWGPNYTKHNWPLHLDTPPYRLNADEFLDMANYDSWGGYTKHIDKGDGTTIDLDRFDFRTLSFGIKQDHPSIPHHMDFWMDGFKKGETIIRYDLVRTKADTAGLGYGHRYPIVTGFTPYGYEPMKAWPVIHEGSEENGRVTADDFDDLNDERDEITPNNSGTYYNNNGIKLPIGQLDFISVFFSDADEFGDKKEGGQEFEQNGYLRFKYTRNKYPLRFNTDPTKIKDDSEFSYPVKGGTGFTNNKANALETFYEFPLKCLSPDLFKDLTKEEKEAGKKQEYFGENPKNFLDNPDNLYKLGLYDLLQRDKTNPKEFAKDKDGHYRVKRPEGLSDQMVFKGWAMDPAGKKMVWKNKDETMPFHPMNLYAIWDEPDYKWKVTVDPNGGTLGAIDPGSLTTEEKTIKEGDIGREKENTYPVKGYEDPALSKDANEAIAKADKEAGHQVFTVVQKQKLKNLPKPERYGYDFLGWEVIRYKKDKDDNYTNEQDTSYRDKYKVPELYSFGTDVVSPIYLKAIWVENKRANVKVLHYYLKNNSDGKLVLDTSKYPNPDPNDLAFKRVGDYVPATGEKQDEHWILATNGELMEKLDGKWVEQTKDSTGQVIKTEHDLKPEYEKYNERVKLNNTFFQSFRVQDNINVGTEQNPVYKENPENIFRFYYRPFRTRNYKVNYIDVRGKAEIDAFFKGLDLTKIAGLTDDDLLAANNANKAKFKAKRAELEKILDKYKVIDKEDVTSECRHYDARNYRHIPGWTLASSAQQQLFYDVNEDTNEFLGINGTGSNEIYFYYKDARVIETKEGDPVPDGYVRVTFKIDDKHKGGVFKDKDGKEVTELHYDVIKGLKSNNLPHPIIWEGGKVKEANRYYITPDQGKTFKEWNNDKWLNAETEINKNYTFTAYFDWSGMSTKSTGLVRTEAFKDPDNKWTNDFAPKLFDLKEQLVWKEGDEVKPIPDGTDIKFVYKDDAGQETVLTKDEDIYNLVKELNEKDAKQTVRVLNIVAKVTFKGGKTAQELPVPITVYKNRYEALNENWEKPKYLSDAEGKEAKDGGLKDVTGNYVKVTVSPTGDMEAKDNKVYYVNPKAWVEIPQVKADGSSTFINWTADQVNQNDDGKEKGKFDFAKRHMFTKDTIITPVGAADVVEQEKGKEKPDVPKTYVKVIVKTTDKATDETAFERTFWVNPKADVTIDVTNPTGKTVAADATKPGTVGYKMDFFNWKSEETTPRTWKDKIVGKFEKETTIVAKYSVEFEKIKDLTPKTDTVPTPQGKTPTVEEITKKITPPAGKTIKEVKIVKNPDVSKPGDSNVQVIVEYTDGSSVGTNDKPLEIPVKVHEPIVKANPDGSKPESALDNYVKVIFTAGTGGKLDKTLTGSFTYYVSPEVEVDLNATANAITATPFTGYTANGAKWENEDGKNLKDTFKKDETVFKLNLVKSKDIVEKIDDSVKKPEGYVTVKFIAEDNGQVVGGNKTYFVNPDANIKLVEKATEGATNELVVPQVKANDNYSFKGWVEPIDSNFIKGDQEHVAKFEKNDVTLTYDAGEGKGTVPPAKTAAYGATVRLANADGLTKDNSVFAGWKIDNATYQPGQEVTLNGNTTATAQWKPSKHTVTFNTMGGTDVASQEVAHGNTATNPQAPKLDGKVFMGWKENVSDENYFNFTTPITANKTLIAIWQDSVQKIDENATVEGEFIKVTFKQGAHGQLVPDKDKQDTKAETVTYKVAKNLSFDQAVKQGMKVPGIQPAQYFKAKTDKAGWDKALELNKQDITFTAQYDLVSDLIPVDTKGNTPEEIEKLKQDKPEGTVVVDFKIADPNKTLLDGITFYYVKKDAVVTIDSPAVMAKTEDYTFDGWKNAVFENDKFTGSFSEDTTITDTITNIVGMTVRFPVAGQNRMDVLAIPDDETGKLQVIRAGNTYNFGVTTYTRRRKTQKMFNLSGLPGGCIQSGDMIKYWTEKNGQRSTEFHEVIK